jgi:hypothetical protein
MWSYFGYYPSFQRLIVIGAVLFLIVPLIQIRTDPHLEKRRKRLIWLFGLLGVVLLAIRLIESFMDA